MIEIDHLHAELRKSYSRRDWEAFHRALGVLAKVGDHSAEKELSRHALALIEIMGKNGAGRHHPGGRVDELFDKLMVRFSSVQWQRRSSQD